MFGFRYRKTGPTTYTLLYRNGSVIREGIGLSFWYFAATTIVVEVPLATVDVPFFFEDLSADFQSVNVQGQLTYRVSDPKKLAALMDYSTDFWGRYTSEDPRKLNERLVSTVQVLMADRLRSMPLRELLTAQQPLSEAVLAGLRASPQVAMLGLEILSLVIVAVRPSPETAKALEADAREQLLRQADEAVYARRNAAVQQERTIKESELNTELAVEEKKRQIREKKLAAEIAAEEQRLALVATRVENERKQADAAAYALEAKLKPLRETDWRTLLAASSTVMDPRTGVALALRELAENAAKIGNLNVSPDLLAGLMDEAERTPTRGK
jgi:hypothetical protein